MPGSVIGKVMNLGFIGKISRDGDAIVINRIVSGEEENPVKFGAAVFLNDDNTVRNVALEGEEGSETTSDTIDKFVGIAVAEVIQATEYTQQFSAYLKNKPCDILVRGSIIVEMGAGTPVAGGKVYYNFKTGKFDATDPTASSGFQIPASFTTGYVDGKGGVEITLLERNLI